MEFFNNLYTVFVQVIILAVIAAVGFFGDRVGFFTEKASRLCNDLLFYVVTPCVIVNSFASTQFSKETAAGYFSAIGCFFFSFSVAIAVSFLLFRKGNRDENAVYRYSVVYGNNGYMGLPLSAAVMAAVRGSGDIGIFYCSAAVVVFNIFCFTHGVWLMSGGGRLDLKKLIINPGTLSVLVGLPIFFFNIKLPAIIATPITHIGNMNTPLAMIMLGTYFSHADLRAALKRADTYISAAVKLIAFPLVMILLFRGIGIRGDLLIVASVAVGVPTASNTAMFAAKYGKDTALASQLVGFSSVLSIITLPACVALGILLS